MTTIITSPAPGQRAEHAAMKAAVDAGFNCYSKPCGEGKPQDHTSERGDVFYYAWHGKLLEVIVSAQQQQNNDGNN